MKPLLAAVFCLCIISASQTKAQSEQVPSGVLSALAEDEQLFCDQFTDAHRTDCEKKFRSNVSGHWVVIAPGREAFAVENKNMGACGTSGCSLLLFMERRKEGTFSQILGQSGELGELRDLTILGTTTNGYHDLEIKHANTVATYKWDGTKYYTSSDCVNAQTFPKFEQYPVNEFNGSPHSPLLRTRFDRLYRTRIRESVKDGPNFAGHYVVADWGCGTGCLGFVIVDLISGEIVDPPFQHVDFHYWLRNEPELSDADIEKWTCDIGNSETDGFVYHKAHSGLLAVEGCLTDGQCGRAFYVIDSGRLRQIAFDPDLLPDGSVAPP